jgi:hypothetical protein
MAVNANQKGIQIKSDRSRDILDCACKHVMGGCGLGRVLSQVTISQYLPQSTAAKGGLNITTNLEVGDYKQNKVSLWLVFPINFHPHPKSDAWFSLLPQVLRDCMDLSSLERPTRWPTPNEHIVRRLLESGLQRVECLA